jgi:antitoxin component HigA of HigAB toxin-antitoxin module
LPQSGQIVKHYRRLFVATHEKIMDQLIKTETDHEEALAKLEELMLENPDEGTTEANELELLARLIEVYEGKVVNFP